MNARPNPDVRVDQILTALRTTDPPADLEARIAARLAQARTQTVAAPSFFAPILRAVRNPSIYFAPTQVYAAAALTVFAALTTLVILHRGPAIDSAALNFNARAIVVTHEHDTLAKQGQATDSGAARQSSLKPLTGTSTLAAKAMLRPTPLPSPQEDPDQLALAETLAPSRAAPLPPLTAQEKTLVAATRPGQPIQLAELDLARAPILCAEAQARQDANIRRYVKSLLAPFAVADALQLDKVSEPREISTAIPAPPPTSSPN